MKRIWIRFAQAVFLGLVAWGVWRSLGPALRGLEPGDFLRWRPATLPLVFGTLFLLAMFFAHAFLWRRILADLAIGRPDARTTVRIYFLAGLGRYVPGKVLQLVGFAVLAREAGMSGIHAVAAAIIGQLAFLATGLLLLAMLLPGFGGGWPALLGAGLLAGGAAVLWVVGGTRLGHGVRERIRSAAGERMGARLQAAFELADRVRPRAAFVWLAGYAGSWVLLGIGFTLFVMAFIPEALGYAGPVSGSLAASYVAGYLTLVPAGIGVREGALATLLARIAVIPAPAAVVIALSSRIWATVVELMPLALMPFLPTTSGKQ